MLFRRKTERLGELFIFRKPKEKAPQRPDDESRQSEQPTPQSTNDESRQSDQPTPQTADNKLRTKEH